MEELFDENLEQASSSTLKRTRRPTSIAWNEFDLLNTCADGRKRAKCKNCGQLYVVGGAGTSNLLRHMLNCPSKEPHDFLPFSEIDQEMYREKMATVIIKVKLIREKLYLLFGEYVRGSTTSTSNPSSSTHATSGGVILDEMDEFDLFESQECGLVGIKSELDLYLDESRLDRKQNMDMDILCYWKSNNARYPILSSMARDLLSIPITTVASESAFSIGGRIIDKFRSSIMPKNAEALLCTRDWLYNVGVVEDENEDEEGLVEDFGVRVAALSIKDDAATVSSN